MPFCLGSSCLTTGKQGRTDYLKRFLWDKCVYLCFTLNCPLCVLGHLYCPGGKNQVSFLCSLPYNKILYYQLFIDFFIYFSPPWVSFWPFKVNGIECLFLVDQSRKPFLSIYYLLIYISFLLLLLYCSSTIASLSSQCHCTQTVAESPPLLVCFFFVTHLKLLSVFTCTLPVCSVCESLQRESLFFI